MNFSVSDANLTRASASSGDNPVGTKATPSDDIGCDNHEIGGEDVPTTNFVVFIVCEVALLPLSNSNGIGFRISIDASADVRLLVVGANVTSVPGDKIDGGHPSHSKGVAAFLAGTDLSQAIEVE